MERLILKVPPTVLLLFSGCLMLIISSIFSISRFSEHNLLAFLIVLEGSAVGFFANKQFKESKASLDPRRPEVTSVLVTRGIYHISRNPMYLGMLLLLIGWGVFLREAINFTIVIGFICYMNIFQIIPEEKVLLKNFGNSYYEYCSKTRRWM